MASCSASQDLLNELLGFPHRDCPTTHFLALMAFLARGGRFHNPFASVSFVTLKAVDKFAYPLEFELLDHTCSRFCLLVLLRAEFPTLHIFLSQAGSLPGWDLALGHLSIIQDRFGPSLMVLVSLVVLIFLTML